MERRESDGTILETKRQGKNIGVCGKQNFVGGIVEEKYKRRGKHARLVRGTPMIAKLKRI